MDRVETKPWLVLSQILYRRDLGKSGPSLPAFCPPSLPSGEVGPQV